MIDTAKVARNFKSWQSTHPPRTGYTEKVFDLIDKKARGGEFTPGTNLFIEAALQYTGKEEYTDHTKWDTNERRIPYSQSSRYSLDYKVDCSSWIYIFYRNFFGINIGTWTEAQYDRIPKIGGYEVEWEERRPTDIVQYNMKIGRRVSHDALIGSYGKIIHTTSDSNPFREENDTYRSTKRVVVWRVLSDEQYQSLIIPATIPDPIFQHAMWLSKPPFVGEDVKHYQAILKSFLETQEYAFGKAIAGWLKVNGTYGLTTYWAVKIAQWMLSLPATGGIDYRTAAALDNLY